MNTIRRPTTDKEIETVVMRVTHAICTTLKMGVISLSEAAQEASYIEHWAADRRGWIDRGMVD